MKKKMVSICLVAAIGLSTMTSCQAAGSDASGEAQAAALSELAVQAQAITDIEDHWTQEAIQMAVENGWVQGTSSTTFSPDAPINRGMFVTILGRMAGADTEGMRASFSDVPEGAYYAPYAAWASKNGIAIGVSETVFDPERSVSRQEMAVMLFRFAQLDGKSLPVGDISAFSDSRQISGWAEEAVSALSAAGIMTGKGNSVFDPAGTATRAEAAVILTRYADYEGQADYSEPAVFTPAKVPADYYIPAEKQGTLETFAYQSHDYVGNGEMVRRSATVYLPYGYEESDVDTRYNILYLQHGAYGTERTWMVEYGDAFKNMIDHMIEDGLVEPMIIVMPYLPSGNQWYHDTTSVFYQEEIRTDLMPAVESRYHTYAEDTSDSGFAVSRSHRAFGGFSAGGTTTWQVFLDGLDRFEYFMPLSGGLTLGGSGATDKTDAKQLSDATVSSGYGKRDYFIFAATGTRDVAYQGLTAQIEAMKSCTDAFDFTESGFAEGNLMYYTVEENRHDYQYTYEYIFNGLPLLFHEHTTSADHGVGQHVFSDVPDEYYCAATRCCK